MDVENNIMEYLYVRACTAGTRMLLFITDDGSNKNRNYCFIFYFFFYFLNVEATLGFDNIRKCVRIYRHTDDTFNHCIKTTRTVPTLRFVASKRECAAFHDRYM